jgi:hypothetical protein
VNSCADCGVSGFVVNTSADCGVSGFIVNSCADCGVSGFIVNSCADCGGRAGNSGRGEGWLVYWNCSAGANGWAEGGQAVYCPLIGRPSLQRLGRRWTGSVLSVSWPAITTAVGQKVDRQCTVR